LGGQPVCKRTGSFAVTLHSYISSESNLAPELTTSFQLEKDESGKIFMTHPESAKLAYVGMFILNRGWCKFAPTSEVTGS